MFFDQAMRNRLPSRGSRIYIDSDEPKKLTEEEKKHVLSVAEGVAKSFFEACTWEKRSWDWDPEALATILRNFQYKKRPCEAIVCSDPEDFIPALLWWFRDHYPRLSDDDIRAKAREVNPHLSLWDVYQLAYYQAVNTVLEIKGMDSFADHDFLPAVEAGAWTISNFGGLKIAITRPRVVYREGTRILHCEDGPAIEWRETKIYYWNGQEVPAEWILTPSENLDPMIALTWEQVEQRTAAGEIIGWHRVLEKVDAVTIDDPGDPSIGVLKSVRFPDAVADAHFLVAKCGTGRTIALMVPNSITTALEANAWTNWEEVDSENFLPEVRT